MNNLDQAGKTYPSRSVAGKGDAPRNVSNKFKENFDGIEWIEVRIPTGKQSMKCKNNGKRIYKY